MVFLEKAFDARHEYDGFIPALIRVIHTRDIHHVLATTIAVTFALIGFNAMFVVRRHIGKRELLQMFLSPFPEESKDDVSSG